MFNKVACTFTSRLVLFCLAGTILFYGAGPSPVYGRSAATPWTSEMGYQNLVYGATSALDVEQIMGYPDEVLKVEQMYPVIVNYYYYEKDGTGAATVFVFENNLLAGLHYKSADNQFIDLTYFLPNNGDKMLNLPVGGFRGYYPNFGLYGW